MTERKKFHSQDYPAAKTINLFSPEGSPMATCAYFDDETHEIAAKDAKLIVEALNAYTKPE